MPLVTAPPGHPVVLWDGQCGFCKRSVDRLARYLRDPAVELASFREQGALDRFPGLTFESCRLAVHLIEPDGRVYRAAEAFVRLLMRRRLGKLAAVYFVPGVRQIAEAGYRYFARTRGPLREGGADAACGIHEG